MEITVSDFIDTKLIQFSAQSNVRGVPFFDGFKESQRKALWGILHRGESADTDTVERIAAATCSVTDYKHGTVSMEDTIAKLARNYAGSNNIPLLEAHGQFGNRLSFENSAPRYIKTKLSPNFRMLFPKADDIILEQRESNGMKVEPKYFVPLLPITLVNGGEGIGTGHSTNVLSYNVSDLITNIKRVIKGEKLTPNSMIPYFKGFTGDVTKNQVTGQVIVTGKLEKVMGRSPMIRVTEIPVQIDCESYKEILKKLMKEEIIKDFDNLSGEESIEFHVWVDRETINKSEEELLQLLKLVHKDTENVTLWDANGVITNYDCVEELLEEFVVWRLAQYQIRKDKMLAKIDADIIWAKEKIRFIRYYLNNVSLFRDTPKKELIDILLKNEFEEYDKLLDMPMWNLTQAKIKSLEEDVTELESERLVIEKDTPEKMYIRELGKLKF